MAMRVKETVDYTDLSHPECQPGWVWLTNCDKDNPDDFEAIGYQTKITGKVAYDINGKEVPGLFPVFVRESEYNTRPETKIGQ